MQVKKNGPERRFVFLVFSGTVEQTVLQAKETLHKSPVSEGHAH